MNVVVLAYVAQQVQEGSAANGGRGGSVKDTRCIIYVYRFEQKDSIKESKSELLEFSVLGSLQAGQLSVRLGWEGDGAGDTIMPGL